MGRMASVELRHSRVSVITDSSTGKLRSPLPQDADNVMHVAWSFQPLLTA